MAVHVTFFNEMMSDEMRTLWHSYRTASLLGHPGRNVAWDYLLERMNCEMKQGLHGCVTRERLDRFAVMLNGFKHVDTRLTQSWGVEHPDVRPTQYTHLRQGDIDGVVGQLEELLGKDRQDVLLKARVRNPFGSGSMPWTLVERATSDGLDDFIRQHLDGLRTDEA